MCLNSTHKTADELAERPPDGQHGEQILVRGWDELQKYGGVYGEVPAHTHTPHSHEGAKCDGVRRCARGHCEDPRDEQREVERPSIKTTGIEECAGYECKRSSPTPPYI